MKLEGPYNIPPLPRRVERALSPSPWHDAQRRGTFGHTFFLSNKRAGGTQPLLTRPAFSHLSRADGGGWKSLNTTLTLSSLAFLWLQTRMTGCGEYLLSQPHVASVRLNCGYAGEGAPSPRGFDSRRQPYFGYKCMAGVRTLPTVPERESKHKAAGTTRYCDDARRPLPLIEVKVAGLPRNPVAIDVYG